MVDALTAIEQLLAHCASQSMQWAIMMPKGRAPVIPVSLDGPGAPGTLIDLRDYPQFFEAIPHSNGTAYHFTAAARDRVLKMRRPV